MSAAAILVVAVVAGVVLWMLRPAAPRLEWRRLTNDASVEERSGVIGWLKAVFPDGLYDRRCATAAGSNSELGRSTNNVGGHTASAASYQVLDITPDGQDLLIGSGDGASLHRFQSEGRYPVSRGRAFVECGNCRWIQPAIRKHHRERCEVFSRTESRLPLREGEFDPPGSLWLASADGSNARRLLESKDLGIVLPCWSADGRSIAFGQIDRATQKRSVWVIGSDGTGLRRFLPDFPGNHLPAAWTPDGNMVLISEGHFWFAQPRRHFQLKQPAPIQLSTGDPLFSAPVQFRSADTFYAVGRTQLGQLQRLDRRTGTWVPHLGGASYYAIEYSMDGQRLLSITHPGGDMWVRRADGNGGVQLTKAPMESGGGRWSPDGRTIAFSGRSAPDQPWRIYLVDAAGGSVRPACPKECRG